MSKKLPEITHVQFLILEALADNEAAGRDVRALLTSYGLKHSAPAFYQMMGRLEEARLVEGWYEQRAVAGQSIKERRYRLTRTGSRAVADTRAFYEARLAASRAARRPAHA